MQVNYRHAFHAGNHADVLKHAVLVYCLDALRRKPAPFAVLDTHAGRGLYDLAGDAAQRSPEWRDGLGRLWDWRDAPALIGAYLDAVRAFNADGVLRTYPGSPALTASRLRPQDVMMACELHAEEHAALRRALPQVGNLQLHHRDGWEAAGALLPPPTRRGLVMIDPPYEAGDEMAQALRALSVALSRFGHGVYMWWRPLKDERALAGADGELRLLTRAEVLRVDLWVDTPAPGGRLAGSSIAVLNPPFGLSAALKRALPALALRLQQGCGGWRTLTLA